MYWELRCCGGKSHILTIQHRISKIAENSLVKFGIWLPYNSSLSRSMQPRQTYSPGFTNGRTDRELRQAINPSAAMLRSGLNMSAVWQSCPVTKPLDPSCGNSFLFEFIMMFMHIWSTRHLSLGGSNCLTSEETPTNPIHIRQAGCCNKMRLKQTHATYGRGQFQTQ